MRVGILTLFHGNNNWGGDLQGHDQHPLLEGHLPQGFYCAQGADGKRRVQEAQSPVWLPLG